MKPEPGPESRSAAGVQAFVPVVEVDLQEQYDPGLTLFWFFRGWGGLVGLGTSCFLLLPLVLGAGLIGRSNDGNVCIKPVH